MAVATFTIRQGWALARHLPCLHALHGKKTVPLCFQGCEKPQPTKVSPSFFFFSKPKANTDYCLVNYFPWTVVRAVFHFQLLQREYELWNHELRFGMLGYTVQCFHAKTSGLKEWLDLFMVETVLDLIFKTKVKSQRGFYWICAMDIFKSAW